MNKFQHGQAIQIIFLPYLSLIIFHRMSFFIVTALTALAVSSVIQPNNLGDSGLPAFPPLPKLPQVIDPINIGQSGIVPNSNLQAMKSKLAQKYTQLLSKEGSVDTYNSSSIKNSLKSYQQGLMDLYINTQSASGESTADESNIDNGVNNTIKGKNNVIQQGDSNSIHGQSNTINGSNNQIYGHNDLVQGSGNVVISNPSNMSRLSENLMSQIIKNPFISQITDSLTQQSQAAKDKQQRKTKNTLNNRNDSTGQLVSDQKLPMDKKLNQSVSFISYEINNKNQTEQSDKTVSYIEQNISREPILSEKTNSLSVPQQNMPKTENISQPQSKSASALSTKSDSDSQVSSNSFSVFINLSGLILLVLLIFL